MTARVAPSEGPPFGLVAPFFLVAPIGLIAAGLLILGSSEDALVAINLPRTVAITHALLIGWITTTLMGATYQLGPAVIGGPLLSTRLARWQLGVHVVAVPLFVWSLMEWQTTWMSVAGGLLAISFILYAINGITTLARGRTWTLARAYLGVALLMLAGAATLGVTWVGAVHHGWFPVSMGRLSAHAHLGLLGWLGLALMGVSYQLVPMFNVVNRAKPRFGWLALAVSVAGLMVFVSVMFAEPGPGVRVGLWAAMSAGPSIWAADQVRLMLLRSRRKLDIQGRATLTSVGFLGLTIGAGLGASLGTPMTTNEQPARWLLAYAATGILGWIGIAVIGNSYKILPFLVWFHRYRSLVGTAPVPVMTDIYSERVASSVLAAMVLSIGLIATGALGGNIETFRLGGLVLALTGVIHEGALLWMLLPKHSSRVSAGRTVISP